jgi:hypothetical protein
MVVDMKAKKEARDARINAKRDAIRSMGEVQGQTTAK